MSLGKEPTTLRCKEPHAGTLANGSEYMIVFGQLVASDAEPVKKNPQFFEPAGLTVGEYVPITERPEAG